MKGRGGRKDLTVAQQLLFLRKNPALIGQGTVRANTLTWLMDVQPTPLARTYRACITYSAGEVPKVQIVEPDLELLANGRPLPHVYRNPLTLCLYLPGAGEWAATKRLDQTTVPWTYLWLFYFEDWLATDSWKGGGLHPGEQPETAQNRAARRSVARRIA
jgi:hypothetical protein